MRTLGIILIVAGLLAWVYGGFSYIKHHHAIDAGPIQLDVNERKTVSFPPIAGAVAVVAGVLMVAAGSRRRLA